MRKTSLSAKEIKQLLQALNDGLGQQGVVGEIYLVGGAVMCLAFHARPATKDVDAYFTPPQIIRELARKLADDFELPENWLNDAVKGYLSKKNDFTLYLDMSHLKVFHAVPEYLLAMKCLAMRLGPEFHDESDIRYLLRYLNIENYKQATGVITRYYPLEQFPQKTLYALEEMLAGGRKN